MPADIDVPPTSTPSSSDSPVMRARLQVAEVAERDARRGGGGARGGDAEADHLHLALAAVAAVGEVGVEPARMRHELRYAERQRAQMRECARRGPVRVRPRLAEEI